MGVIRKKHEIRMCKHCGKEFINDDFRQIYCSYKCQHKYHLKQMEQRKLEKLINPPNAEELRKAFIETNQEMAEWMLEMSKEI
jgi:hypothetical protein